MAKVYGRDGVQRNQGISAYALLCHRSVMQHRALGEGAWHTSTGVHAWTMVVCNVQVHDRIMGTLATQ